MDIRFCECGLIASKFIDGKNYCEKHYKKPNKPKHKKGIYFSGDSKWREEMGMFQAKEKR